MRMFAHWQDFTGETLMPLATTCGSSAGLRLGDKQKRLDCQARYEMSFKQLTWAGESRLYTHGVHRYGRC